MASRLAGRAVARHSAWRVGSEADERSHHGEADVHRRPGRRLRARVASGQEAVRADPADLGQGVELRPGAEAGGTAKEVARTKAAPVVADMVADAARATGEKLRSSRTVTAETIETSPASPSDGHEPSGRRPRRPAAGRTRGRPRRRAPTAPPEPLRPGGLRRPRPSSPGARTAHRPRRTLSTPCGAWSGVAGPVGRDLVPCTAPSRPGAATPSGPDARTNPPLKGIVAPWPR